MADGTLWIFFHLHVPAFNYPLSNHATDMFNKSAALVEIPQRRTVICDLILWPEGMKTSEIFGKMADESLWMRGKTQKMSDKWWHTF